MAIVSRQAPAVIYLDHNSTTPLSPTVAEAMAECWRTVLGNPASQHAAGRKARRAIEDSREAVARALGAQVDRRPADRLVFTSGGTEANNLALFGLAGETPGRVLISAIEHPSITAPAAQLARRGWTIERLPVSRSGVVDLDAAEESLRREARLLAVMLANNETGVLQPIAELGALCRNRSVALHCDAVQAVGKIAVDFTELGVDSLSVGAHKFNGPIGVGALVVKAGRELPPLLWGGFQQAGARPGTESAALAVGMRVAIEEARAEAAARTARLESLQRDFESSLLAALPGVVILGDDVPRLPQVSQVAFPGIDRQAMVVALDLAGVACSTGAACASGSSEPSPTLLAMGRTVAEISSAVRFSWGHATPPAELNQAIDRILMAYKELCHAKR